jgi:plastocyanin
MNNKKIIVSTIVVAVVIGIIYVFYTQPKQTQAPGIETYQNITNQPVVNNESTTTNNSGISVNVVPNGQISATVIYDGVKFSPTIITIKQGSTVNFIDKSGKQMWIASNLHPAHIGYDGTSRETHCAVSYVGPKPFDECSLGTSFSFMFSKIGSWSYHDHVNSNANGTVVVSQ